MEEPKITHIIENISARINIVCLLLLSFIFILYNKIHINRGYSKGKTHAII